MFTIVDKSGMFGLEIKESEWKPATSYSVPPFTDLFLWLPSTKIDLKYDLSLKHLTKTVTWFISEAQKYVNQTISQYMLTESIYGYCRQLFTILTQMGHLLHNMDEQRMVWRVRLETGRLLESARDVLLPKLLPNETKGSIDDLLFRGTDAVITTHTIGKKLSIHKRKQNMQ